MQMSVDAESLASFRPDKENRRARPIPMQMEHRESARLHEQSSVEEAPATAPARGRFTPPPDHGTPADGTLFGTEQLNAEEVERLLASRHARLVVCLGEEGSGKTSLCIELYERQRGRATGADFAGSWTLLAFEQLAHRRRTTGDVRPTSTDEFDPDERSVLHLALRAGGVPLHLLFADLPGELFQRLADNQIAVSTIPWMGRADKLVVLVNGARLVNVETRSQTLTRTRQLLERLRADGLPGHERRLALLVTKWDAVREDPVALSYWTRRESQLLADARELDNQAVALRSSTMPHGPDGLAALRDWLLEIPPAQGPGPQAGALPPHAEAADTDGPSPALATIGEVEWPVRTSRRIPLGRTALRDWFRGIEPGLPVFDGEKVAGSPLVGQSEHLLPQSASRWLPWTTRP